MASTLSLSAIHQIIFLIENDHRPTCDKAGLRPTPRRIAPRNTLPDHWYAVHNLQQVNSQWKALYKLFMDIKPAPPCDYLDSLALALVLKGEVDDGDVRAIFAHGKPMEFWGCPPLLVSKVVEAFRGMQEEPGSLDVTITALSGFGATRPSEAWSEVYTAHLPCYACATVETVEEQSIPRLRDPDLDDPVDTVDLAIEKFHVSSMNFAKHLTVELHFELEQGTTETEPSSILHKIAIRLVTATCPTQGSIPAIANRSSSTSLLLPEFSSEVYGFLERAHVGSSLLANRDLHDIIYKLKQRLPVHHLTCRFEPEAVGGCMRRFSGAYWLEIRHFQRDCTYTDVRRFKMPSTTGAGSECALIRHYLSNSHVADLQAPHADFGFAIKMLADLARRNFSVGKVEFCAEAQRLSDYRSMDVVFGGLRMDALHLSCEEHCFVELVKTTDFFRMSTVQRLRKVKLDLSTPWATPSGRASSKSPLWVSGIYLLLNCEYYRVNYRTDRHLRSIEHKMVQICEEFERGKITDTVEHFHFDPSSSKGMNYAFSRDNLLVSGMKVKGKRGWDRINNIEWDVYRFRNASTSQYLTTCVGRSHGTSSILHISKGEVLPDASFAKW